MDITAEVLADFRQTPFTAVYHDATVWPDANIIEALTMGDQETGSSRWGSYSTDEHNHKRRGMYLYACAWLYSCFLDDGPGTLPTSEARLNIQSKSVGDESVAYRVPSMMHVGDDALTYSHFGQQFWRLRRRIGMGALAV